MCVFNTQNKMVLRLTTNKTVSGRSSLLGGESESHYFILPCTKVNLEKFSIFLHPKSYQYFTSIAQTNL